VRMRSFRLGVYLKVVVFLRVVLLSRVFARV